MNDGLDQVIRDELDQVILDSIWQRIQWDFLMQNPQLSDWLESSCLFAGDEVEDGKPIITLIVERESAADWLNAHTFVIERALSVEMKKPVVVKVWAAAGGDAQAARHLEGQAKK